MLVRDVLEAQAGGVAAEATDGRARLPAALKRDKDCARTVLLRGLSATRLFALGDRAGVLRAAQRRSGRAFRLDVRQRVIVKALVSRHAGGLAARRQALGRHVSYLGRSGAGADGARPDFFDRTVDSLDGQMATAGWTADRHHFRFIISPEHGDRIADLRGYVREVMARVADDLGQPSLVWIGTCHFDTDQPHAHVLVRGRREDGRDLVLARDYISYGFRGRAQEVAQARLGDLSRAEAERRIWRETSADRFTGFDRRLLAAADGDGLVDDGVGRSEAWAALTRGRLRHLEALGLAERTARRYRLRPGLEAELRALQLKQDIIRTLHTHRLEGSEVRQLEAGERVKGQVVATGHHDELGAVRWVVVRAGDGTERYARLGFGASAPTVGRSLDLQAGPNGLAFVMGRSKGLERD